MGESEVGNEDALFRYQTVGWEVEVGGLMGDLNLPSPTLSLGANNFKLVASETQLPLHSMCIQAFRWVLENGSGTVLYGRNEGPGLF